MITDEEASRAGRNALALWAVTCVVLLILGVLFANGTFGGRKAPAPPQSSSAPAAPAAPAAPEAPAAPAAPQNP
jgi:hypothetical protein